MVAPGQLVGKHATMTVGSWALTNSVDGISPSSNRVTTTRPEEAVREMDHPSSSEIILQVVRGERPLTDLQDLGISITIEQNTYTTENPMRITIENPRGVEADASALDIARGILRYRRDPEELRTWAAIVLGDSNFLGFLLEDHPDEDPLLGALWDASFGEPLKDEAINTAERLVAAGEIP
jgi:hypothetical protein